MSALKNTSVYDRCVFCDVPLTSSQKQRLSSRTEEHVFARWFRDDIVNRNIKMFTATLGEAPILQRQPPLETLVNSRVCRECNNGWMSTMEESVAPVIRGITSGRNIECLSKPEIELLARWTGKTAVVLSHVTPQLQRVPMQASKSLHPRSEHPKLRFFYSKIEAHSTLECGFLQLVYGSEIGLVGTDELPGTRITLCLHNHLLTVDFPPIAEGIFYNLDESCSARLWPSHIPAGLDTPKINFTAAIGEFLYAVCASVKVGFRLNVRSGN